MGVDAIVSVEGLIFQNHWGPLSYSEEWSNPPFSLSNAFIVTLPPLLILFGSCLVHISNLFHLENLTTGEYLLTASIAKLIAAAATYPHEVIRTRLRETNNTKYKGLVSGLIQIGKEEGVRGLYGGMGPHLWRVVPNAAIMFLTYELVLKALTQKS